MELRDRKLYRSTHKTFEEYCKDRFSYNRSRSYQLIDAAGVVDNLYSCPQIVDIFPTKEGQVRPLTQLEPFEQCEVWQQAVAESGGKVPSGRVVKDIVERIRSRTKVLNPYRLGEVCQIIVKDNPDLRGKNGCWCIVTQVNDYSCTVQVWDGLYTLKLEHLKPLDYSDMDCEQMNLVCVHEVTPKEYRITRLRERGKLEQAATSLLQHIGQVKRPYLTPLEEKLLSVLEQEYEVGSSQQ
jgi:hypothetical protein